LTKFVIIVQIYIIVQFIYHLKDKGVKI